MKNENIKNNIFLFVSMVFMFFAFSQIVKAEYLITSGQVHDFGLQMNNPGLQGQGYEKINENHFLSVFPNESGELIALIHETDHLNDHVFIGTPLVVTSSGNQPNVIHVENEYYMLLYRESDGDGWAVLLTVDVASNSASLISSVEFDTGNFGVSSIEKISGNNFFSTYKSGTGGYARIFSVDTTTETISFGSRVLFDSWYVSTALSKIDDTHFLNVYSGSGGPHFMASVLEIDVSTDTITPYTPFDVDFNVSPYSSISSNPIDVQPLDPYHCLITYEKYNNRGGYSIILTVDPSTYSISAGDQELFMTYSRGHKLRHHEGNLFLNLASGDPVKTYENTVKIYLLETDIFTDTTDLLTYHQYDELGSGFSNFRAISDRYYHISYSFGSPRYIRTKIIHVGYVLDDVSITLGDSIVERQTNGLNLNFTNYTEIPTDGIIEIEVPADFSFSDQSDFKSYISGFSVNGVNRLANIDQASFVSGIIKIKTQGLVIGESSSINLTFDSNTISQNPSSEGLFDFRVSTKNPGEIVLDEGYGQVEIFPFIDNDGDGFAEVNDCNDSNALIYPGAPEQCNNIDDNCDGDANDEALMTTWYLDIDNDGYGTEETGFCVDPPKDFSTSSGDCDIEDESIYPGAPEIPNDGIDQDCDGYDLMIEGSFTLRGTLYRSTHTEKTKIGFKKEDQREVCLFTKRGTKKDCDRTNNKGKFNFKDIAEGKTYYLISSSKRPVTRSYYFERMAYYKKMYEPTFGDLWKKKFTKKYRIKKAKNKGYPYDVKYYRKYKGVKEVETEKEREVDLYLR